MILKRLRLGDYQCPSDNFNLSILVGATAIYHKQLVATGIGFCRNIGIFCAAFSFGILNYLQDTNVNSFVSPLAIIIDLSMLVSSNSIISSSVASMFYMS